VLDLVGDALTREDARELRALVFVELIGQRTGLVVAEALESVEEAQGYVAARAQRRIADRSAAREVGQQQRDAMAHREVIVRRVDRGEPAAGGHLDQADAELGDVVEVHELGPLALEEFVEGLGGAGAIEVLRGRARRAIERDPRDRVAVALLAALAALGQLRRDARREDLDAVAGSRERGGERGDVVLDARALERREAVGNQGDAHAPRV
jgi:hypothetical protein